jgi:hypothetical protein
MDEVKMVDEWVEYDFFATATMHAIAENFIDKLYLKFPDDKFREILVQISTSLRTMRNIDGYADTPMQASIKLLKQITAKYHDDEFIDIVAMASLYIDQMQQISERKA